MAVVTGTNALYGAFKLKLGTADHDLTTGTYKVLLASSTYTPNAASDTFVSDASGNEISGNGYARQTVTVGWTQSGANATMTATDANFTASGGSITARYWVLFQDLGGADSANPLIAYGLLNSADADVTATDTNTLTVDFSDANGVFTI